MSKLIGNHEFIGNVNVTGTLQANGKSIEELGGAVHLKGYFREPSTGETDEGVLVYDHGDITSTDQLIELLNDNKLPILDVYLMDGESSGGTADTQVLMSLPYSGMLDLNDGDFAIQFQFAYEFSYSYKAYFVTDDGVLVGALSSDVFTAPSIIEDMGFIKKPSVGTSGNFVSLDESGGIQDSGKKASDFGSAADVSAIYNKMPSQVWNEGNEVADKAFVNSTVQTGTANFRGSYETVRQIPDRAEEYPVDYKGGRTPTPNDYMVVEDVLGINVEGDNPHWSDEASYIVGEICIAPGDVGQNSFYICIQANGYDDPKIPFDNPDYWRWLESWDIMGEGGAWRFKYSGTWSENGIEGWIPEYKINDNPLTAAQVAALNSNITSAMVGKISNATGPIGKLVGTASQLLTEQEKAQARINIGAPTKGDAIQYVDEVVGEINKPTFGGLEISQGPLYYNGTEYEVKDSWNYSSYGSVYGKNSGSTYFDFVEMGQLFEKPDFDETDGDIENLLDPLDGWRLPTKDEFDKLITTNSVVREGSTVNGRDNSHWAFIQLADVDHGTGADPVGLLLFPDGKVIEGMDVEIEDVENFTDNVTEDDLNEFLAQGCVFLPTSGYYLKSDGWDGLEIQGYYWSSTDSANNIDAWYLGISSDGIASNTDAKVDDCYTVRLVREYTQKTVAGLIGSVDDKVDGAIGKLSDFRGWFKDLSLNMRNDSSERGYAEDSYGSKIPHNNDYIFVDDCHIGQFDSQRGGPYFPGDLVSYGLYDASTDSLVGSGVFRCKLQTPSTPVAPTNDESDPYWERIPQYDILLSNMEKCWMFVYSDEIGWKPACAFNRGFTYASIEEIDALFSEDEGGDS